MKSKFYYFLILLLSITVTNAQNTAPTFTSTAITTIEKNTEYSYAITTTDVDGDDVDVTATTLPSWLTLNTVVVSTLAGDGTRGFIEGTGTSAQFNFPNGVVVDASGNLFVADGINNRIRKITPAGVVSTIAGSGASGFADNANPLLAQFSFPNAIAIDASGNLFVCDNGNQRIRKITPTGVVSTLAGSGVSGFANGTGTAAQFKNPNGVAVDNTSGNVYVSGGSNRRIRKITPAGEVSTLAGTGASGDKNGAGNGAKFSYPNGIAVDASGNVYVSDASTTRRIRKITPAGVVSDFAGSGDGGSTDGSAATASFSNIAGLTIDASGNVYVADTGNHNIRKITAAGTVSTIAGNGALGFSNGIGNQVQFNQPNGLAIDATGNLYVADVTNHSIRKIEKKYTLKGTPTVAGVDNVVLEATDNNGGVTTQSFSITVADTVAPTLLFLNPADDTIEVSESTDLVISFSENIVAGLGDITIFASSDDSVVETIDVTSANVTIIDRVATINPTATLLPNKSYYVQVAETTFKDSSNNDFNGFIDKTTWNFTTNTPPDFTSTPIISTKKNVSYEYEVIASDSDIVTITGTTLPSWLSVDVEVEVSTFAGSTVSGNTDGAGTLARFNNPRAISADKDGNLFVVDEQNHRIRKITPSGVVSTFAGSSTGYLDAAVGTNAKFKTPKGITVDPAGNIYVADPQNHRIRKIAPAGTVSTIAGNGASGFADGIGVLSQFSIAEGVATDAIGNIYVTDRINQRIRKISLDGVVSTFAGSGSVGFADNTDPLMAQFNQPQGIVVDVQGNIYTTDRNNHRIRKIDAVTGEVSTFAGSGVGGFADNTDPLLAQFNFPLGLAVDINGNVYVADTDNNRIRKITPSGNVTTIAGLASGGSTNGSPTVAKFSSPSGIALDENGTIYVADASNDRIRKIKNKFILKGTPTSSGIYNIVLTATDGKGETSTQTFSIEVTETNGFTGSIDSDWSKASNWNLGRTPIATDDINIYEDAVIGSGVNPSVENIAIDNSKTLFVDANGSLTINGNLTLATGAALQVTSTMGAGTALNPATVILKGTYTAADATGQFFYFTETNEDNSNKWSLISSPVIGEGIKKFVDFVGPQTSTVNTDNYGLATYKNDGTAWDYYTGADGGGGTIDVAGNFIQGKGYSILPNSALAETGTSIDPRDKGNIGFQGDFLVAAVSIPITVGAGNAFNLVGNPYPSFIAANTNAATTNNILAINSTQLAESTLWFWDKTTASYTTVNLATAAKFIAPAQGFFVKSKIGGGTFSFTKAMQSHQATGVFSRNSSTRPEIQLSINSETATKTADVYYINGTTTGFDDGYDSSIFGGANTSFSVYTHLVANNQGQDLGIQSLPDSDYENMVIPLGINAQVGKEVTCTFAIANFPQGIKVYLEDRIANTFHRLDQANSSYTFTNTQATNVGRFFIHTTASVLDISSDALASVSMYVNKHTIYINGITNADALQVYDLLGKRVFSTKIKANNTQQIKLPNTLKKGIYIVQLQTEKGKVDKKVILD